MQTCVTQTFTSSPCLSSNCSHEILKATHVVREKETASVKLFPKIEEVRRRRLSPLRNLAHHIQPFPRKNITSRPRHHPQKALCEYRRRREVVLAVEDRGGGVGSPGEPGTQQTAEDRLVGGGLVGGGRGPLGDPGTQQQTGVGGLVGRVVAFTTPLQYAGRFEKLLRDEGAEPLWCPTIVTEQSEQTRQELEAYVGRTKLEAHGIAFTSRAGIRAVSDVLNGKQLPLNSHDSREGLQHDEPPFIVAALGKDAELLQELNVIADSPRVSIVVPAISTPHALAEALGKGNGRKILCPVPLVEGLEEPPVVPQFFQDLRRQGWDPVRLNSYITRWMGWDCAKPLLLKVSPVQFKSIDALVFTSTAEIEGLLKSCGSLGLGVEVSQRGSRNFLVACHGPVTAQGAQRLGVEVDVVGKKFQSFAGVIKALEAEFRDFAHIVSLRGENRV